MANRVLAQERVGERRKMNNGLRATILEMTGKASDAHAMYKVQFEDGTVVDGVRYSHFKGGHVAHPSDKMIPAQNRVGERKKMNNGLYATILEITGKRGRTTLFKIQFEDGAVREGVEYSSFKRGGVAHPKYKATSAKDRIGERRKMNGGKYATILEITGKNGSHAMYKVQFEDGSVVDGVHYSSFNRGNVAHPNDKASGKIRECRKMNNGMYATIIEITGKNNHNTALYKVKFEDGEVVDGVEYGNFKSGSVAHPTFRPEAPLGEREIAQALIEVGLPFVWEYTAEWLKDNGRNRSMDFFIPDLNLFIEFHGRQHFEYIPFFHDSGGRGHNGLPAFWEEKAVDDFKWKACHEHGCDVWYFADDEPYTEDYRYPVHKLSELVDMLYDRMGVPAVG